VPGYAAPQDTVAPATRPVLVLTGILRDAAERGASPADPLAVPVQADLAAVAAVPGFDGVPAELLARGIIAWTELFGAVSFELFGRLTGAITDYDAWFEHQLHAMAAFVGLQ
jgi:hypothetical protein